MSDLLFMLTVTVVSSFGVGVIGWLALRGLRRQSVTLSVVVCALVPVVAVIVAVQVNVRAMFLSDHDADVMSVVLSAAAVLAIALAVILGRRLAAGSRSLGARLARLGEAYEAAQDSAAPPVTETNDASAGTPTRLASAELSELTAQLDDVHRKLEASRAREQALETSRRDLVAALSHDLRTPLAGVRALAEGLEDGVVDDVPTALSQIRANTERMARIADDLFELSRLQAVPKSRRDILVSLRELADDVVAEARPSAEAGGVHLEVNGHDRLPVRGDGDELARALANLVSNAIKHTPAGGTVTLAGTVRDGCVVLSVADGCGGIAEQDLPQVFEAGWRGQPARSVTDEAGTGLGLAIVREVAIAHGGAVAVHNADRGCRFEVSLPAA